MSWRGRGEGGSGSGGGGLGGFYEGSLQDDSIEVRLCQSMSLLIPGRKLRYATSIFFILKV